MHIYRLAVALNLCSVPLGVSGLGENLYFLGVRIKLGLNVGQAVDTGDDHSGILAKTVQDNAKGLNSYLVCVQR